MKYNLSKIMLKAWKIYRKTKDIHFAEALHRAWLSAKAEEINAKRIENAKQAAGIIEETNTFAKCVIQQIKHCLFRHIKTGLL